MVWTIVGFSVAIIATFCVCLAEFFSGNAVFESSRPAIAGFLGVGGLAALAIGIVIAARDSRKEDKPIRFILFDLRFWGPLLLVLAGVTHYVRALKIPLATAKPELAQSETPAGVPQLEKAAARPPKLQVQGVIYRESQPTVILNGNQYSIGDHMGDVIVRAIDRRSITLEIHGKKTIVPVD